MIRSHILKSFFVAAACVATFAQAQVNQWSYIEAGLHLQYAAAAESDGFIYVFGGLTDFGDNPSSAVEAVNNFGVGVEQGFGLPLPLYGESAVTMSDGRIVLVGGFTTGNAPNLFAIVFDPKTSQFTVGSEIQPAGITCAARGANNSVVTLAFDGTTNSIWGYEPNNDVWLQGSNAPADLGLAPTAVLGKDFKIYFAGGLNGFSFSSVVYAYDDFADSFTKVANMNEARYGQAAAVGGDGRIYEYGGFTSSFGGGSTASAEAYDPKTGIWTTLPDMEFARGAAAGATDRFGNVVVIGGENDGGFPDETVTDTNEIFHVSLLSGAGNSLNTTEGQSFSGTVATFSDGDTSQPVLNFTASVDWGDGSGPTAASVTGSAGSFTVSGTHTYAEAGNYTVTVSVSDTDGESVTTTGTATVADADLSSTGSTIDAHDHISFSGKVATFTDSNPGSPISDYTAHINWGDGSISTGGVTPDPSGGYDVSGSHTYTAIGVFATSVTVSDVDGATTTAPGSANVTEPPPVITGQTINATEGLFFSGGVASFTDADATLGIGNFTASITWGDGALSTGTVTSNGAGGFYVSGSHTYEEEGVYSVGVTVSVSGQSGSSTGVANVADAPLTATGYNLSIKGTAFSNTVATFVDADPHGTVSDYSAAIIWGDGKSSTGTVVAAGSGFKVVGSHSYAKKGRYVITVTIRDTGGSTATATTQLNAGPVK